MGGWCFDGIELLYDCTDIFVAGAGTIDSETCVNNVIDDCFVPLYYPFPLSVTKTVYPRQVYQSSQQRCPWND